MGDAQCSLCLSCGVPFFPDLTEVQSFNRLGVQSLVFLNVEYKDNRDIRLLYKTPRFSTERQAAHIIHQSHHATALDYMCNRHTADHDVGAGVLAPAANALVPNANNVPFLFMRAPTGRGNRGALAAAWVRPPRNRRIRTRPLFRFLTEAALGPYAMPVGSSLNETFFTCEGCNYLMTRLAGIRYILGHRAVANRNPHGAVIGPGVLRQYGMVQNGQDLPNAYGNWRFRNPLPVAVPRPARNELDGDAPHVAYYLHMCLPYVANQGQDVFAAAIPGANRAPLRVSARALFLEQCWLLLEIAAVATMVEEGKVTEPNGMLSHGIQQHYGVLDLYVSYFVFRLAQFRYGRLLRVTGVDFVQWHQKYYWDAKRCVGLFPRGIRSVVFGQLMYGTTAQASQRLIQQLCYRLVSATRGQLRHMISMVVGRNQQVPRSVRQYFVPPAALQLLRGLSRQVVRADFHAMLNRFGAGVMLFRIIDLCANCPSSFLRQLQDLRDSWQLMEIERVRRGRKDVDFITAQMVYYMAVMLDAPAQMPVTKQGFLAMVGRAQFASFWNSVLALSQIGAFREST